MERHLLEQLQLWLKHGTSLACCVEVNLTLISMDDDTKCSCSMRCSTLLTTVSRTTTRHPILSWLALNHRAPPITHSRLSKWSATESWKIGCTWQRGRGGRLWLPFDQYKPTFGFQTCHLAIADAMMLTDPRILKKMITIMLFCYMYFQIYCLPEWWQNHSNRS